MMVQAGKKRAVGRPREFDEEQALEAAMDVFWEKGFEATSMADLCAATGLHKGSLYQAFGDKHALFMQALKAYADREFHETAAVAFAHDSPLASIRAVVGTVCKEALEGKGCLMINSLVELAPHDPEVHKALLQRFAQQRIRVHDRHDRARHRQAGEIRVGAGRRP